MSTTDLALPTIALVTPSFNQARFLEATLRSIHDQGYPRLEHVVMDGGSTDQSVDIIRRYADRLTYWVSAKDAGQYDAINRGFTHTRGEIMAWLNSDDIYLPWTFRVVGHLFAQFPQIQWLTTSDIMLVNAEGIPQAHERLPTVSSQALLRGEFLPGCFWFSRNFLQQESTFWRRSLWEKAGGRIDTTYDLAGDFELWLRFAKLADLYAVSFPLACFRDHGCQRSSLHRSRYDEQALTALRRQGYGPPNRVQDLYRRVTRHLPRPVRKQMGRFYTRHPFVGRRLGGLFPTHLCRYDPKNHDWRIQICW